MTKERIRLTYIENNSRRKACYKKRKLGFTKKVEELTTLCGVQACVIIYSHFDAEPQIWPPEHSAIQQILMKFKNLSTIEQNRRMMTQESFTTERMKRIQEQCKKLRQDNRQKELNLFVAECLSGDVGRNFTLADLNEMKWSIRLTIKTISRQIEANGEATSPTDEPMMPNIQTGGLMFPTIQTTVPTGFLGFDQGYGPVFAPQVPLGYSPNPTWGMNLMGQNPQVPPGMSMNFSNPTWGMNMVVQNEQVPGFANSYNNPAIGPSFMNGYPPMVVPEMLVDYPQNPTSGVYTMVPNEQAIGFANGYNTACAPHMVVNDPQNPTSGMNAMVPPQQSADPHSTDWICYVSDEEGGGRTGFPHP